MLSLMALALVFSCTQEKAGKPIYDEWYYANQELPEYITVKKGEDSYFDVPAIVYFADVDMSKASFNVWGIEAPELEGSDEPLQTPSQVYKSTGKPAIVINAGYFYSAEGKNYSSSLEVSEEKLLSPNINYASRDWVSVYYPTRAAFIEYSDGSFEAAWTYWQDAEHHYIYSEPAKNSWDAAPLQVPDANFPCEAKTFAAKNAIGGAPVLVKAGKVVNSYQEELIDIDADIPAPRTAIGITADKHLVLFVCEGRNMTEGVPGFTTLQVAQIMKDYGCVEAINLDGGGSSMMLVLGEELIKPSDGKQRAVASCVYIK